MRKFIFVMAVVIMLLSVGCSKAPTESKPVESESVVTESNTEHIENTEYEIKYADLIPDPKKIFADGSVSIIDSDGGEMYAFEVSNFKDNEFVSYVSECKALGFDDVQVDTEDYFAAYSSDGKYWAQANIDENANAIYVICKKVDKEK